MSRHTSPHERRRLIASWRASGQSAAGFARDHDIASSTFATWVKQHPLAPPVAQTTAPFVALTPAPEVGPDVAFAVTVGAHALQFDAPPPPSWFANVLRELATC